MKKLGSIVAISAVALGLAACGETRNERTLSGALIGTGVGAAAGGLIAGNATGAVVGGALRAAGGAVVGSQTRGDRSRCYATNRYGERYRVPCRY